MLILSSIAISLLAGVVISVYLGVGILPSSMEMTSHGIDLSKELFPFVFFQSITILGLLIVAVVLYISHPFFIRYRRGIQSLSEKDKDIQEHITKLAAEAGIEPPTIEMPLYGLRGSDAQVFGIGKTRKIALDGGLRIFRKTKPHLFSAIISHELGHIANFDVGKTYFSDALSKSIRWLLIVPFLFVLPIILINEVFSSPLNEATLEYILRQSPSLVVFFQCIFVSWIPTIIWRRLLKTRELYADWRASAWGYQQGLSEILQEQVEKNKFKSRFNPLTFHPETEERLHTIKHPEILFIPSVSFVLLAGILVSYILAGLTFSFSVTLFFSGILDAIQGLFTGLFLGMHTIIKDLIFAIMVLPIFIAVSWLINLVVLSQVQRQTVMELINGKIGIIQYIKLGIVSLALVIGIEIGLLTTPFTPLFPDNLSEIPIELLINAPTLFFLVWWYLWYLKFITRKIYVTQTGKHLSVWRNRFIGIASKMWIVLFFSPGLFLSRFFGYGASYWDLLYISWFIFTILVSPLIFGVTWLLIKLFFDHQFIECPHCGKKMNNARSSNVLCDYCGGILREWVFLSETQISTY